MPNFGLQATNKVQTIICENELYDIINKPITVDSLQLIKLDWQNLWLIDWLIDNQENRMKRKVLHFATSDTDIIY